MPSGGPRIVALREQVLQLRPGPGFSDDLLLPCLGVDFVEEVPVPVPLDSLYIGCGDPTIRLHPSPWCNPFAPLASSEEEAHSDFKEYAFSRADASAWLHPLSGMRLIAETGIKGVHAVVLSEILDIMAEASRRKRQDAQDPPEHPDDEQSDSDEINKIFTKNLPYEHGYGE